MVVTFPRKRKCKDCGKDFTQYNPLQTRCTDCTIKKFYKKKPKIKPLPKPRKKINHIVRDKREKIRKLEKKADSLFQQLGKRMFPRSIVSGKQTQVIHHYCPKSQSNNLRYDFKNACPATNGEHYRHHQFGDPTLSDAFRKKFGQKRIDYLTKQRQIHTKQTVERLESIINDFEERLCSKDLPF